MSQRRIHPLGALWIYTVLRFGLFGVLFLILWLFGVGGLLGALIALVLSVPLSFVLLAKPRSWLADGMNDQLRARQSRTRRLDADLSGTGTDTDSATNDGSGREHGERGKRL